MKSKVVAFIIIALLTLRAEAQDSNKPWEEYSDLIKSKTVVGTLGPDLFGDQVSFSSGVLSFNATDVSVPGNFSLPVAISRSFTAENRRGRINESPFADWEIELPRIEGVYATATGWVSGNYGYFHQRCSITAPNLAMPPSQTIDTVSFSALDYWQGPRLTIPGGSGGDLMLVRAGVPKPATGGPYYWTTSDRTHVACLSTIKNSTGEGFLAITPDGTKYWFDWMASAQRAQLRKKKLGSTLWGVSTTKYLPRRMYSLYATRAEDRFGNWVEYSYNNGADGPVRLTSVQSSDGRIIALSYNAAGQIALISAHGQSWTYTYSGGRLSAVVLPDGTSWGFNFGNFAALAVDYYEGAPGEAYRDCLNPGDPRSPPRSGTVVHPSGAVGEFTLTPQRFGRSNVPMSCDDGGTPYFVGDDVSYYPVAYDHYALTSKRVTGPGLDDRTWAYTYQTSYGFAPHVTSGSIQTEVLAPDGSRTRYVFGNTYRANEGLLLRQEVVSATGTVLRQDVSTYELAESGLPYVAQVGTTVNIRTDSYTSEFIRPAKSRAIGLEDATFSSTVTAYDTIARPVSVTEAGPSGSRVGTTEYLDELNLWVLGSVARSTMAGLETSRTEFGWKHLPWKRYSFGRLTYTLGYETGIAGQLGSLKTAADGNSNITMLGNWKRGIPQTIKYPGTPEVPAGATQSAVVSDSGWITSITDENGYKTCYAYDTMGRISQVTHPSESAAGVCDTSTWTATTQVFQPVAAAEYGVPAGHWRQTVSTGNARKITYFDALWRPLVVREYDTANEAGTQRFQRFTYDHDGRMTFASYPGTTDALSTGTWTEYDALGRTTSVTQDSELGALTTLTAYSGDSTGPYTRVTDPRGTQTVTRYQMFDQPTYEFPVLIDLAQNKPERAAIDITRDVFGKPLSIRKRNNANTVSLTRSYTYNANQELCRSVEPETGATLMGYDGAGNLTWSASGLPAATACHATGLVSPIQARRSARTYDGRNRVATIAFPDNNGNQSWTYTADGLPAQITTVNTEGASQVVNAYTYNRRRLLVQETQNQPGELFSTLGYGYNSNGHLASHAYPSGLTVAYAPNALGQPTQAGTYATAVTYYPNGAAKQFTYGNGIVHQLLQNARGLPSSSCDAYGACGAAAVLNDGYGYDRNGNVAAITDGRTGNRGNRTMTYDGLDRLTGTVSPMFGTATYAYDVLDNLTRVQVGATANLAARDHYYCYDAAWRLGNVKTGGCSGATVIGLEYDVQGNLANRNGVMHTFDYGNRLRLVQQGATWTESYRYDAHGRRARSWHEGGALRSVYGQDGALRFQRNDRTGKAVDYIQLNGSLVATREVPTAGGTATVKYQHTDALGSPVAVTDASRTVIERSEYEPYGRVGNRAARDGVGYTGHAEDAATGLTYMQQRYYDPKIGLFLSVDPVTAHEQPIVAFNRYRYAINNPYKFRDPDGRQAREVGLKQPQQEQMVPIPTLQRLKAAQDAAVPKTVYVSGSVASARVGGPTLSASGEFAKATASAGTGGVDFAGSPGSARIDSPLGSASTDGQPTSGVSIGNKINGPGVGVGISNATSAGDIAAIPMTKVQLPYVSFAWGTDSKGNWAVEIAGGAKAQAAIERPKKED